MSKTDILTARESAAIIGQSVATIKRLAKSGTLPHALKFDGRTGAYVFNRTDVEAYAAVRRAEHVEAIAKLDAAS